MAGRIERVVPGEPAESALAAGIGRLQGDDRLAPVWVVVGSAIVGLSLRRRLVADGAFAAVRFTPLGALAEMLGGIGVASFGRQPLRPVALRAAARVALAEVPSLFSTVADHPATEASLASTYGDLRRLSRRDLDRLAETSPRAYDVVGLMGRMRALLEVHYYDSTDVLAAAITGLEAGSAGFGPDLAEIGGVIVYLPDPLPPEEIRLLTALARRTSVSVLVGRTGDELADRAPDRFVEGLRDTFCGEVVEESSAGTGPRLVVGSVLSAPDDDVEVREAVRRLIAHAEAGGDLGGCVVSFPDGERSEDLGRRVREQLRSAGIASSGRTPERLIDTPHGQLVIGLVQLSLPVAPGNELDRGEVMAWLGRGPIRAGQGLTRGLPTVEASRGVPVGAWDRCSRAAGVLSGIDAWRQRLGSYAQGLIDRQSTSQSLLAAQDLAAFIERLHALTSAATVAQSWTGLHRWLDGALAELLEPDAQRDAVADALTDLDGLDGLEPLGHLPTSERLRRFALALEVTLDRPSGDRGRYGVGPTVAPLGVVAGARSDLLLVLGCREGDLPSRHVDDPLVPRFEREQIGGLVQQERSDERARRHLVSLLLASECAQASFPRIDVRAGRFVYPSRWTGDLVGGPVTEVPSFAGSVRRVADGTVPAADSTDFELASLVGWISHRSPTWLDRLQPDYARRRESGFRRRYGGLSPFAGHVPAAGSSAGAWSETVSPTRLQDFAKCPFSFFLQRRLGVKALDAPESLLQIDGRERGTLMHDVLEGFFRPGREPWAIAGLDDAEQRRLRSLANEQFARFELLGRTGKALFWDTERSRILRDLERYVARDLATLAADGLVPVAVELEFGERPPLVVRAAGRDVCFRGRIDRVDHAPDGRIVVVDYKSGKADSYRGIFEDALGRGRYLQLPIYAKAALQAFGTQNDGSAPVRAEYRFLQASAGFAVVPVELTVELDHELTEVLGTLVSTIDAGCFPPRPGNQVNGKYEHCRYCDFDALCTTDRAELWQSAATDPRMWAYAELVTGEHGSGDAGGSGRSNEAGGSGGFIEAGE